MGSRAIALVCRDPGAAARKFGAPEGETGALYTRTGRSFFGPALTEQLLDRLRAAITTAGLWDLLDSDWLLLDAELLPWSAKALELLRGQYAAVGAAATSSLTHVLRTLESGQRRGLDVAELMDRMRGRAAHAAAFVDVYRAYCWPVDGLDGVQLAPFQVLASERRTWQDTPHRWHLDVADRLVAADPVLVRPTRRCYVEPADASSVARGIAWWEELTAAGGEGMVVKPAANLVSHDRFLAQPGLKVRGPEYLRLIYGPDYSMPEHLARLRSRGLGHKRSMALREYALGIESLERLVAGEPLWRVHEPVFAVLALESEPVDPRL